MSNDIEKRLKDLGSTPPVSYPNDLKTATRAEYTTLIKQYNKDKKGCPLTILYFAVPVLVTLKIVAVLLT